MDFIQEYLSYVGKTEAPYTFHRWAAIGGIGALLGKSVWFDHGGFRIYPNMYIQLFGVAGSRKSTSIKRFVKLLKAVGYKDFSAEKTSKEKFIEWLSAKDAAGVEGEEDSDGMALWQGLDGPGSDHVTRAMIAADEFTDFFSTNILDFLSFLGVMWDYEGSYEHSTRAGGSVVVTNPCISILSGNTPTMLAHTIPPEALGQGFFSRTVVVYGEETGIKIAFPTPPDDNSTIELVKKLKEITSLVDGRIKITKAALDLCEKIYLTWSRLDDPRLDGYGNRRFNQLLKLCIIHCVADGKKQLEPVHVIRANTVLTRAEMEMPKALGEFGSGKFAGVTSQILKVLETTSKPMTISMIWEFVHQDLDRVSSLSDLIMGLAQAKKIQVVNGGFLLNRSVESLVAKTGEFVDWNYLTLQERSILK